MAPAGVAPAAYAAYPPPPPRPPAEPERPWWRTAAGWLAAVAVFGFFGLLLSRVSSGIDKGATQEAEVKREMEHLHLVSAWLQDTSFTTPPPGSGRPAPTSDEAKRLWVVGRLLVEGSVWRREVLDRHGVGPVPAALGTARYTADARAYPQVETYLEGGVAAITELDTASAAWMEGRVAALAKESGMAAQEIREVFPVHYVRPAAGDRRFAEAQLELHRHLVRIDPRVHHAGGDRMRFEREEDVRRLQALETQLNDAMTFAERARAEKLARERAGLPRVILQVPRP
jgi:hypothetical protein